MNDLYYQKLKSLVDGGRLQTYIIIAPPRTNSSVVEHALGNSPDVNHECHEPFLNARRLEFEKDEFKKLAEEVTHFEEQKREHFVFDTTDLRAAPEEQMQELCTRLGINFSPEMVRWGEKPVDFHTEQTEQFEKLWYDTLYSSSRINPPTEIPPTLDRFPEFMQEYLKSENLPIYAELSKKKILKNELRHELNEQEFQVEVTDGNKEHLHELGFIEGDVETGERVSIKLKHIDPIYAVLNEPKLIEQAKFQIHRNRYKDEIQIVSDIVPEGNEHTREIKRGNGEIKFR